jgi:hypothetical protein
VAFFLVRKSRAICILGGLAVGTTLNGECSGSEFGFFHQTYGIAFGFAFMSLLGMYFVHIGRYPKYAVWRVLPFALLLAAVLYAYPEISPFVVFGGFTWGCKPKTSEFIGRVRKGRIYCKLTQARMASRSMGCRLSLKA